MKIALACIVFICLCLTSAIAQKNDTIYFIGGDKLTGEFKKAEYGLVFLTTEGLEKVTIEFDNINTIYSAKRFEFRMDAGNRYYGSISTSKTEGTIIIVTGRDSIQSPIEKIAQIVSIKNNFIQKIDGSFSLGLNYTKASEIMQFNVDGNATYRSNNYAVRVDFSSIVSDSKSEEKTYNNNANLNVTRYFPNRWFTVLTTKGQQNTELDLDYRIQGGAGGGYDMVRTSSQRFYGLSELLFNYEQTIDSSFLSRNGEILLSLQYKWFKYRHPKVDLTTGLNYYPNLTVDRHRLEYDFNAKFEIIKDLFFSLTFYDTFDSKNISTSDKKNDYGIVTSISCIF